NREIPMAKSLVDYIFRWLAMEFVPGYRDANAPKREKKGSGPVSTGSVPTASPVADADDAATAAHSVSDPRALNPASKKEGNGHGRHVAPDAKPFEYSEDAPPANVAATPASPLHEHSEGDAGVAAINAPNLRLAIISD